MYNICHSDFPSATEHDNIMWQQHPPPIQGITSANKMHSYNICQYNAMAITSFITMCSPFTPVSINIAGHTNIHAPKVLESY